jgi:hypothetical protein
MSSSSDSATQGGGTFNVFASATQGGGMFLRA